ncbi:AAA family ATPase [Candidatus Daviesbacteria bacterium]|nr:AAA family ATPase [Candidatus Daviesbacteria bacterium]
MKRLIIGLVGEKGSGKGTFTSILKETLPEKAIDQITFSDVLTDSLNVWALPPSRENYIKMMVSMKNTFGGDVLANAIKARVEKLPGEIVVIDGMRWPADEVLIRSFPKNVVLYITAVPKIRYERTKSRGQKAGEKDATFEQFMEQESAETEVYIPKIGEKADFTINNDGPLDEFIEQVKTFSKKHVT